jgi:hypothetical protein
VGVSRVVFALLEEPRVTTATLEVDEHPLDALSSRVTIVVSSGAASGSERRAGLRSEKNDRGDWEPASIEPICSTRVRFTIQTIIIRDFIANCRGETWFFLALSWVPTVGGSVSEATGFGRIRSGAEKKTILFFCANCTLIRLYIK